MGMESTVLSFHKFLFCIFFLIIQSCAQEYSLLGECGDTECSVLIGKGKTVSNYHANENHKLSFPTNQDVDIYVRNYGKEKLLGVMIKGRKGFVPPALIKVTSSKGGLVPAAVEFLHTNLPSVNDDASSTFTEAEIESAISSSLSSEIHPHNSHPQHQSQSLNPESPPQNNFDSNSYRETPPHFHENHESEINTYSSNAENMQNSDYHDYPSPSVEHPNVFNSPDYDLNSVSAFLQVPPHEINPSPATNIHQSQPVNPSPIVGSTQEEGMLRSNSYQNVHQPNHNYNGHLQSSYNEPTIGNSQNFHQGQSSHAHQYGVADVFQNTPPDYPDYESEGEATNFQDYDDTVALLRSMGVGEETLQYLERSGQSMNFIHSNQNQIPPSFSGQGSPQSNQQDEHATSSQIPNGYSQTSHYQSGDRVQHQPGQAGQHTGQQFQHQDRNQYAGQYQDQTGQPAGVLKRDDIHMHDATRHETHPKPNRFENQQQSDNNLMANRMPSVQQFSNQPENVHQSRDHYTQNHALPSHGHPPPASHVGSIEQNAGSEHNTAPGRVDQQYHPSNHFEHSLDQSSSYVAQNQQFSGDQSMAANIADQSHPPKDQHRQNGEQTSTYGKTTATESNLVEPPRPNESQSPANNVGNIEQNAGGEHNTAPGRVDQQYPSNQFGQSQGQSSSSYAAQNQQFGGDQSMGTNIPDQSQSNLIEPPIINARPNESQSPTNDVRLNKEQSENIDGLGASGDVFNDNEKQFDRKSSNDPSHGTVSGNDLDPHSQNIEKNPQKSLDSDKVPPVTATDSISEKSRPSLTLQGQSHTDENMEKKLAVEKEQSPDGSSLGIETKLDIDAKNHLTKEIENGENIAAESERNEDVPNTYDSKVKDGNINDLDSDDDEDDYVSMDGEEQDDNDAKDVDDPKPNKESQVSDPNANSKVESEIPHREAPKIKNLNSILGGSNSISSSASSDLFTKGVQETTTKNGTQNGELAGISKNTTTDTEDIQKPAVPAIPTETIVNGTKAIADNFEDISLKLPEIPKSNENIHKDESDLENVNATFEKKSKKDDSSFIPFMGISDPSIHPDEDLNPIHQSRHLTEDISTTSSPNADTSNDSIETESDPSIDFYTNLKNSFDALRSFLDVVISWVPEPLYSTLMELEEKGISPRVPVFTILSSIPCIILMITIILIRKKSKEGQLIAQLTTTEAKIYHLSSEKTVLEDKLGKAEAQVVASQSILDDERTDYTELKSQIDNLKQQLCLCNSEMQSKVEEIFQLKETEKEYVALVSDHEKTYLDLLEQKNLIDKQLLQHEDAIYTLTNQLDDRDNQIVQLEKEKSETMESNEEFARKLSQLQQNCNQLLQEAEVWNERVNELNSKFNQEASRNEELQESISMRDTEIESLKNLVEMSKYFDELDINDENGSKTKQEKLEQLIDSSSVLVKLQKQEDENKIISDKLSEEKNKVLEAEVEVLEIKSEIDKMKLNYNQALQDRTEAQTKLEVLTNYFKDKEISLQRQLGAQEAVRQKTESDASSAERRICLIEQENSSYKSQVASMKQEIEETERNLKSQIAGQEKKAHENWIVARTAERKLEDMKVEVTQLRQRLTLLEREQENWINTPREDILRPVPKRLNDTSSQDENSPVEMRMPPPMPPFGPPPMLLPLDRPLPPPFPPPPPFLPLDHPPHFRPPPPPWHPLDRMTPPDFGTPPRGRYSAAMDGEGGPTQSSPLGSSDMRDSRNSTPPHSLPDFHDVPPRPFYPPPHRFMGPPPFRPPPAPRRLEDSNVGRRAQPPGSTDTWQQSDSRV